MQLFDDPRYSPIRKRYDKKLLIGYVTLFSSMIATGRVDPTSLQITFFSIEVCAGIYIFRESLKFRREIKSLETVRKDEGYL